MMKILFMLIQIVTIVCCINLYHTLNDAREKLLQNDVDIIKEVITLKSKVSELEKNLNRSSE